MPRAIFFLWTLANECIYRVTEGCLVLYAFPWFLRFWRDNQCLIRNTQILSWLRAGKGSCVFSGNLWLKCLTYNSDIKLYRWQYSHRFPKGRNQQEDKKQTLFRQISHRLLLQRKEEDVVGQINCAPSSIQHKKGISRNISIVGKVSLSKN